MNRFTNDSLHSVIPNKNVSRFSDLFVKFLLKKERTFFFSALPLRSRVVWWNNTDEVLKKTIFGKEF